MAHTAIVDVSSVRSILLDGIEPYLIEKPSVYVGAHSVSHLPRHLIEAFASDQYATDTHSELRRAFPTILGLLEAYVLYDRLIIDQSSLSAVYSRNAARSRCESIFEHLTPLIKPTVLTETYRDQIYRNVTQFRKLVMDHELSSVFGSTKHSDVDLEPMPFEWLKDTVMSSVHSELFGNSANSQYRALFYHELSQCSGMPLFIHPAKRSCLGAIGRDLLDCIEELYRKVTHKVLARFTQYEIDPKMPPLAWAMLDESLNGDIPLIDVALNMKDKKEFAALRALLAQLHATGHHERLKIQMDIDAAARRIADRIERRSAYSLSFLSSTTFRISEIPAISTILKIFAADSISVPDIILYEKPYVTLYDRWINHSR